MKKIFLLLTMFFYLCAGAFATEINIPHITGGNQEWNDYITIDNMADKICTCRILLYRNATASYSNKFSINPYSSLTVNAKELDFLATCGVILFDDDEDLTCTRCRMAYRSSNGGVAEFELDGSNKSQLSFNFSNNFPDFVQWKGIAVMNSSFSSQNITLYALGKGKVLGTAYDTIFSRSQVVGPHSKWFPQISIDNIESIIVTSLNAPLTGITISGNYDSSKLLFTPAMTVTLFKDLNNPDLQLAKRLLGTWHFLEVTNSSTTPVDFLFARIDNYDSHKNKYNFLLSTPWIIVENEKAYYDATEKHYTLGYQYENSQGRFTKIYIFSFEDDWELSGSCNIYDSSGNFLNSTILYGMYGGPVSNNNADEDLDFY